MSLFTNVVIGKCAVCGQPQSLNSLRNHECTPPVVGAPGVREEPPVKVTEWETLSSEEKLGRNLEYWMRKACGAQIENSAFRAELARSEKRCAELAWAIDLALARFGGLAMELRQYELSLDGVFVLSHCDDFAEKMRAALTMHNEALAQSQRDAGKVE